MLRSVMVSVALVVGPLGPAFAQPAVQAGASNAPAGSARRAEEGRPFIKVYQDPDVGGNAQVWAVLQDTRGVLYAGVNGAVIEFDGARWRRIKVPGTDTVRSLDIDENGRIYVGGSSTFGYLAPDERGNMHYVPLVEHVPEDARRFGDVWRTLVTPDGVIFQTERAVYRWAGGRITVIPPATRFNRASKVDGRIYLTTLEAGLNVLEGDTFKPLPGTERLAAEPFPVILRYDDRRLLIGTRTTGLFLYDGAALVPFPTELDALWTKGLYRGTALPDGTIALTTTNSGMGIIDRQGRRVTQLTREKGLPSDSVYFALAGRDGALWLGLDNGIARVESPSPLSFYDDSDGIPGIVSAIRYNQRLYVASGSGVAYLEPASGTAAPRFIPLMGPTNQCWWFTVVPDPAGVLPPALTVACSQGLLEIKGEAVSAIKEAPDLSFRPAVSLLSRADPSRLWLGLFDGLASVRRVGGRWIDEGRVSGVTDQVRTLAENEDGSLWAGTQVTGALLLTFDTKPAKGAPRPHASVKRFGTAEGLPQGGVAVEDIGGDLYFWAGTDEPHVLRFDDASQTFVRDRFFDMLEVDPLRPLGLVKGRNGGAFLSWGRETVALQKAADGTWSVDRAMFSRFGSGLPPLYIYPDDDGVLWLRWEDGRWVRYDTTRAKAAVTAPLSALIRRVTASHDRELYGGAGGTGTGPRLDASYTGLRFEFSAPTFQNEAATRYQSMLEGLDTEWSAWTREAWRDYTNLASGSYRFRVRARGATGQISDEATYAFAILPPWYRTWWAYTAWFALAGLVLAVVGRTLRRRLVMKERERAQFEQASLRAEAAEALARSESEGKKNVELLSEIGREITSSLDLDTISGRLYERINELADAEVFGVGLYDADLHQIEYRLAIENGKRYAPYSRDTTDRDQLPVWCIEHREPVFINDVEAEAGRYVTRFHEEGRLLEDGSLSQRPQSIIYIPLIAKERVRGIITIQSFRKNAYTEHHLNVMQGLATYTAIAIDNAAAYRQLNDQEHEIRRLFEDAERARAAAEEADAAKSAFLSTVSHELRTPLTSVLGFAKIIKKRLEDRIFPLIQSDDRKIVQTIQQVEENLKVVVSEGERLTKLIDDVLDLAKIEAGKLEWHMEPVNAEELIERATAATASLFEHKPLRLVKEVSPGLPGITGDRDRLIQVVINLISNAVKFTDTGSITCRAERRGAEVVVSVVDTGVGIASADQPKVFERFKQVGDTLTDKPKGTGLGLSICREIVEHHGGRVWVESEVGKGSTFSFSLPVPAGEADTPAPIDLAALIRQLRDQVVVTTPRTSDRQPRILIVDDDPNIRELLTQEFIEAGYQIGVATNGREAVREVRRDRPDLIVLDVMMPEMNGFDVAAVLKNDPATMDIPIVILSIVQDRERGFRLGVDRYLTKPIDTDLLFREVGALIEQQKSHKRVLVVDEDATTVRTLSDVLTARGYSVVEARNENLLERAIALQPDIIMLSSVSPARSGAAQMLRFEKGMENVLFLVYQ